MDVHGTLLKAGWGEPTDRTEVPATVAGLGPSRPTEPELGKAAIPIKPLDATFLQG